MTTSETIYAIRDVMCRAPVNEVRAAMRAIYQDSSDSFADCLYAVVGTDSVYEWLGEASRPQILAALEQAAIRARAFERA